MERTKVHPSELNNVMEFDHVIRVHDDGTVTDSELYAPSLYDGELDSDGWSLLNGYSGQWSYSGPLMHSSEYVGGGLARDILATPGHYVVLVNYCSPETEDGVEITPEPTEWAVAFREAD